MSTKTISNDEYEVLIFVHDHYGCDRIEILNSFNPAKRCNEIDGILQCLYDRGLLEGLKFPILSPSGYAAISAANDTHNEQAKQERDKRFEYKVRVATVLVPLITFFLGLFIEYRVDVIGFVISCLH